MGGGNGRGLHVKGGGDEGPKVLRVKGSKVPRLESCGLPSKGGSKVGIQNLIDSIFRRTWLSLM
jgi:hypothetical protein